MRLVPISLKDANRFVDEVHRHHGPTVGHKFSVAVEEDGKLVGVCIVGRPVARGLDDGKTAEVLRLATTGEKNACSMLYGAARRAAKAMGYDKIVTYILESEDGASLRASGWKEVGRVKGRSWDTPSRPRTDKHPTVDKIRYEAG